ncbi:Z1 domain-containing protein [Falsiroseomonas tokyonensis]|uniref:Z1 domain-containing protein n=1 Tax=Falsiroseomonas tokyonensis TaxID=430521 RepID=A0ABV7C0S7_9PROT|nr:Z1 domain-containing protein [Falsiroseomonas tokyonensis]MBU8541085.1 hypothetical protein [Falsiroseomonas tokyonensis]
MPDFAEDPEDMRWSPQPGSEAEGLLAHKLGDKPPEARLQVLASARSILGKGVPPGEGGTETGLVVGYVQSGKTLSFMSVMALARDNGFPLIILIAGSSTQLSDQSFKRLRDDLRISVNGRRPWALYPNPRAAEADGIAGMLDQWRDPNVPPNQRKTVVLAVMKQFANLRHLARLLQQLSLQDIPTLIIDDEADQASLNTMAQQAARLQQNRMSTTYRRILEIRQAVGSHTFLQYTATPQAPLLISIIDTLSPNWVEVLEPGGGYTGGQTFFPPPPPRQAPPTPQQLVRLIPAAEIPAAGNQPQAAPQTLQFALRLFMVGVAAAFVLDQDGNRSMLVHPSVRTADHQMYVNWIRDLFHGWQATFRRGDADPIAQALAEEFRPAYDDLAASVGETMPTFDAIKSRFRQAFNETEIKEVNRRVGGPPVIIEWGQRTGWILVGGLAMDRGFTVEGLTVTYMPRSLGGGNADSLQQRARFFGYKGRYLGFCRVFLPRDVKRAFEDYVLHEEAMRRDLVEVQQARQPLDTWPRRFVLSPALKPCRDNVLEHGYMRAPAVPDDWFLAQAYLGRGGFEEHNRGIIARFVTGHAFRPDDGHPDRTVYQRHEITDLLPLRDVIETLLVDYRLRDPGEAERWGLLLAQLGRMLDEDSNARAVVYRMSPAEARKRAIYDTGRLKYLYQGEYPVNPPDRRGTIYRGDKSMFIEGVVTVQIHELDLTLRAEGGAPVASNVPFLALRLPAGQAQPMVFQTQPNQPVLGQEGEG